MSEELMENGELRVENGVSAWRKVRLSNHIDLVSGYAFKSKDFLDHKEQGTLPVIKIKNVANGDVNLEKVVYHKYDDSLSRYLLSKGDVLIAMTGNHPQAQTQVVGAVSKYKLDLNALLNQRVGKIIPIGSTCLDFVYYFFKDKNTHRYLANESSGSANQANISKATIVGIETNFPEPPEQKAIAEVLSSLDDKIDLLHRQNKTLEQMAETLFRQWFVEEAGEDWEEKKLKDIYIFEKGFEPGSKNYLEEKNSNTIRFIRIADMLNSKATTYIKKDLAKNICYINDLLVSFDGTVGRINFGIEGAYSSGIRKIYSANKIYNNLGLKYLIFNSDNIQDLIKSHSSGTVILHASSSIDYLTFNFPSENIIEKFNQLITPIFNKILKNKIQIRTLEKLRDTLLPKLMSGEVRVQYDKEAI